MPPPREFAWEVPHARAVRRSRALFLLSTGVAALYVVAPIVIVALVLRYAEEGPWHRIGSLLTDLGVVGAAAVIVSALVLVGAVVAVIAWRGLTSVVVRLADARRPTPEEARRVAVEVEPFGLACGVRAPTVWVVDDPAPNALSFGSARGPHVCFTTGAFRLPDDELAALGAFALTALSSRAFAYCTAAIDVVLLAESATLILWATAVLGFLSPIVGATSAFAAGFVLSIAGLVAVTRLALFVTNRTLPGLLDDVEQLVDLEAVRLTENPAAYARLLDDLIESKQRVRTAWPIAHLWFERDEIEVPPRGTGLVGALARVAPVPALAQRYERADPRGLQARRSRALDQAGR